ncbi:MAG: hypothetical protein LH660_13080 [Phormidesmis sp. CAN_BIN36]|nr:hypothetical protein [Phormidesmis sp. CAN_BIN36]
MNIDEFEAQIRDSLENALNQLQTATLMLTTLERQVLESGNSIKTLSGVVETFIAQQRERDGVSRPN